MLQTGKEIDSENKKRGIYQIKLEWRILSTEITASMWDQKILNSRKLTAVDFWATWCPWCMKLKPVFEEVSNEYKDKIAFVMIEVKPENDPVLSRYNIQGIPVIKFFCEGREVGELIGYMPKDKLRHSVDEILQNHKQCMAQSSVITK